MKNEPILVDVGATFSPPPSLSHHFVLIHDIGDMEQQVVTLMKDHNLQSCILFVDSNQSIINILRSFRGLNIRCSALSDIISYEEDKSTSKSTATSTLEAFQNKQINLIIATEQSCRGLDFPFLDAVFIFGGFYTPNSYLRIFLIYFFIFLFFLFVYGLNNR
eukprot:TRINITY_DN8028_c0_g1_i1.p1 TRINITY_DN8028_c0_g1~~TRINITY_DN8028_c0_g1_i1.p1  ORF type:complete len:162 (-),score=15.07 TRINITY_DN8028_c0_g1_i1:59-544(-)